MPSLQQQLRIIEEKIKKQVNDSLKKELATHVKSEISHAVDTEIYQSGDPTEYHRRGKSGNFTGTGSLGDPLEMDHSVGNGQLIVMDNALRNMDYEYPGTGYDDGRSLAYNMIMGYDERDTWYSQPRNFIGEAIDNMRQSGILTKVMREALQRRLGKDLIK